MSDGDVGRPVAWMAATSSPIIEGPEPPTGTDIPEWVPLYTAPLYTAEQMREYGGEAWAKDLAWPSSTLWNLSRRLPDDRGDPSVGIGPTWVMTEDEWYALRALLNLRHPR